MCSSSVSSIRFNSSTSASWIFRSEVDSPLAKSRGPLARFPFRRIAVTPQDVLKLCKQHKVQFVDLRFMDFQIGSRFTPRKIARTTRSFSLQEDCRDPPGCAQAL